MTLERLDRKDLRLIGASAAIAVVSLYVGVRYFFRAFPEAAIEFRTTMESSRPIAVSFLSRAGLETAGYRHAAVFGFDDDAKTFLEREVGVEEAGRLLDSTIRLWRWQHRWFRPLQKEELRVEVTTKGEPVGFEHLLAEEAAGADLEEGAARRKAEAFVEGTMTRPLATLEYIEGSHRKLPHRTDHSFSWKLRGSEVKGADYRLEVGIAGDRVSSYREYLNVPDAWARSYKELRSKNEITGQIDSVLLILTGVAMLVLLVLRIRKGDVRFRAAAIVGAVTFVLMAVSQLNSLPAEFYLYDTTSSFAGFLVRRILQAVLTGLVLGAIIFLIAAAAEPLYRERFGGRLSLPSLLRPRALRTKEFFIAAVVGLTMTCFFFAYENVFYLIANALGAWSPREVLYSDLLSTVFPWAYVLFFGWFPAISEEFTSRMFSIPFLERALRNRAVAIVLAAAIWGFGHATYPNQPFWIRGVEVGLAGIVFGLVFLRFGIVPVVIAHFSVDALYTAFVLIRSESPYYVITGSLSAGIFAVVFLGALVAYVRRGGFLPAELTNEAETAAQQAEEEAARAESAARAAVEGEGRDEPAPGRAASMYVPLSGRRLAAGLAIAAGLVLLRLAPVGQFGEWVDFKTTRQRAIESAATFLRGAGFDVSSYRRAAVSMDRTEADAAQYLYQTGGLSIASEVYQNRVPTPLWRVRFFVPGQKEEYGVSVDPATGAVVGFTRELPEDAPGAKLEKDEALRIAQAFAAARGQDPKAGVLKEQTAKDEKARRDHTFVWDYGGPGMGEAKVRYEVVVQGDAAGSWTRGVWIPEEWRREREKTTAASVILRYLKIPYLGIIAGLAILVLITKTRAGAIPWKFALLTGAILVLPAVVRTALMLETLWADTSRYDTSIPELGFKITLVIAVFFAGLVAFLGGALVAALAGALQPAAVSMLSRESRRRYARDALLAGLVALGFVVGLPAASRLAASLLPSGLVLDGIAMPSEIDSSLPALSALTGALSNAIYLPALATIVLGIVALYFRGALARALLGLFLVLSFLPSGARLPAEYLDGGISVAIVAGGFLALALVFLRDNPLAWVWSAWFAFGARSAIRLLAQSAGPYRQNGIAVLILVVAPALLLVRDALARRPLAKG